MRTVHPRGPASIFFVTRRSTPITAAQLGHLLAPLGQRAVRRAVKNYLALRRRHPGLAVVSVRELFAGEESALRADALAAFARAGRLAAEGPKTAAGARPATMAYAGPFPQAFTATQIRWFFRHMADMQAVAATVARSGLSVSPTHIVLSAWNPLGMTISATNTDKSDLRLYAHTPLVVPHGSRLAYYGDPDFPPSTEASSLWHLHWALHRGGAPGTAVLHFHHPGLREAARSGQDLDLGPITIPCIAPRVYGSRDQGLALARALLSRQARAVTVDGHGTWFIAGSLPASLKLAQSCLRRFSLTFARTRC